MKSTDDLYQLVHSLTQAEKRYVKVFASKHLVGSNNNYLRLFDALLEMEEYDEEELKSKFRGKNFIKHLSSEKNYLHRFILKSMRSFNAESTVDTLLKELLLDARYLLEKRLYSQSRKVLDKTRKLATVHDRHLVLFEILFMERSITIEHQSREVQEHVNVINAETEQLLQRFSDYCTLYMLKDSIFILSRTRYLMRDSEYEKEAQRLASHPLLKQEPQEGFESKYLYHFIHALCHLSGRNYTEADKCYLALISLWEDHPAKIKDESHRYKKTLSNYLSNCQSIGKLSEFPRILEKIRSVPCRTADEEAEEFQNVYYMELLYLMNTNALDKAEALVPDIEKGLKQYRTKINKARELAFYHNIAVLFFVQGKYRKALDWVNKIVNDERSESRQDIQDFARLFQLILHYELGNLDVFEYSWRSAHRYFKQKESAYAFELLTLNGLKQLARADENKKQEAYGKLQYELHELVSGPVNKKGQGFDEVMYWVKSKVLNKPLAEVITTQV